MCTSCMAKFCYCCSLESGIFCLGIFQLFITLGLLITSIVYAILLQNNTDFIEVIFHGVSSTVIFFTSIYVIILSVLLFGIKKKQRKAILPYIIYGIIYILAYLVIIAYTTPIILLSAPVFIDGFTSFSIFMTCVIIGLGVQVYFYVATYSFYVNIKKTPQNSDELLPKIT